MAGDRSIEDTIVDDIMSNTGDDLGVESGNALPNENEPNEQVQRTEQGKQPQQQQDGVNKQPVKQQQQDEQVRGKEPPKPNQQPQPKHDAKGNLIDEKGNIIARAGAERRLNETVERQKAVIADRDRTIQTLQRQVQEATILNGLPQQHGLDSRDVAEAMKVAGVMKRNPIQGAQAAIAFALSQGASLQQIVNDEFVPNVTLDATRRLLDERLGPVARREEQTARNEEIRQKAQADSNQFLLDYPDAQEHINDIAELVAEIGAEYKARGKVIDGYTAASLALQKLQNFAISNNLDPRKAIGPQIEAIKASQGRPTNVPPTGGARREQPHQPRPFPNGRAQPSRSLKDTTYANADASYRDIVREAMVEAGLNAS